VRQDNLTSNFPFFTLKFVVTEELLLIIAIAVGIISIDQQK